MAPTSIRLMLLATSLGIAGGIAVGCAADPPESGFQQVGGGDGSGGDGAVTSSASGTASSTTGPSTSASSASSSASTSSASSSSSTGSGTFCETDVDDEPNDTESTAVQLGAIGDCDDEAETLSGNLDGPGDVDWYRYVGGDASAICSVDPGRQVTSSHGVSLCKYMQCLEDEENFDCPNGTTASTSPDGRPGCCGERGFEIAFSCGSFLGSDDAVVFMRVASEANACVTYSITYDY